MRAPKAKPTKPPIDSGADGWRPSPPWDVRPYHRQAKETEGRTRRETPGVEPRDQPERSGLDGRCVDCAPSRQILPPIFSEVEDHARESMGDMRLARSVDHSDPRGTLDVNVKVVSAAERRASRGLGGSSRENYVRSSCCHVGHDKRRLSHEAPNGMDVDPRGARTRDLRETDRKSDPGGDRAEERVRSGVVLIGEWVPHTEAVLSLEVRERFSRI